MIFKLTVWVRGPFRTAEDSEIYTSELSALAAARKICEEEPRLVAYSVTSMVPNKEGLFEVQHSSFSWEKE